MCRPHAGIRRILYYFDIKIILGTYLLKFHIHYLLTVAKLWNLDSVKNISDSFYTFQYVRYHASTESSNKYHDWLLSPENLPCIPLLARAITTLPLIFLKWATRGLTPWNSLRGHTYEFRKLNEEMWKGSLWFRDIYIRRCSYQQRINFIFDVFWY